MSHFAQIFQNTHVCGNSESAFGNVPMRNRPDRGVAGGLSFQIGPTSTIIESPRQNIVSSAHGHQRKAEAAARSPKPLARRYPGTHRACFAVTSRAWKMAARFLPSRRWKNWRALWTSRCTSFSRTMKFPQSSCASPRSRPTPSGASTKNHAPAASLCQQFARMNGKQRWLILRAAAKINKDGHR